MIDFQQLSQLSTPLAVILLIAVGLRKIWMDVWPWWTDIYWPAREARWLKQAEANERRDAAYSDMTAKFIGALQENQNGFRTQSTLEHERIIQQVQSIGEAVGRALAEVVGELRRK